MIWLNGQPLEQSTQVQLDRGLMYGDGFFTTILLINHHISNWQAHWQRLEMSSERLGFPTLAEPTVLAWLKTAINHQKACPERAVVKIMVTRGVGGRGYLPPEQPNLNIYIQLLPFPDPTSVEWLGGRPHERWPLFIHQATWSSVNCSINPTLAGVKHLNRLENVLAQQQLQASSFSEAIMQDVNGHCVSATQAGLAMIKEDKILFADTSHSGVNSTGLELLQSIDHGYAEATVAISRSQLLDADEVFFCNAVRGVMPVNRIHEKHYAIHQSKQLAEKWINALQKTLI